jgi:hypothetical protein
MTPFEPEASYAGIPYKVLENGKIDAMLPGGLVRFQSMDAFVQVANSGGRASEGADAVPIEPPPDTAKPKRWVYWAVGVPCGLMVAILILAKIDDSKHRHTNVADRISQECQHTFGSVDAFRLNQCKIDLGLRYLGDAEKQRIDDTYRRVR